MTITPRILLAVCDRPTRVFLADNLTADGYEVHVAANALDARTGLDGHALVLCDLAGETLALIDGLRASATASIAILAAGGEIERVRLLEHGADDVVVKPVSYLELRARIVAVLRRCQPLTAAILAAGPVVIDRLRRRVTVDGRDVRLSVLEFELLCQLASDPTRVFTRQELMREVWGQRGVSRSRTLDTHAHRLRRRLGVGLVQNQWGVGYRLMGAETA